MQSPDPRLVPDPQRWGAWIVRIDGTDQSYVDPTDPTYLEFDYVQRVADTINTAFAPRERICAVHVGGAGMTIPRYIAYTRPTSAQIVLEPDAALTEAVRAVAPLPYRSGIKVRTRDGRAGMRELADDYADLVVLDAFAGARVPAELGTEEWFAEVRRVVRPNGTFIMNLTDFQPLAYARRVIAGISRFFAPVVAGAESSTWKARRFGNIVVSAGGGVDPLALEIESGRSPFPYRLLHGPDLDRWLGPARPFTDADAESSVPPPYGPTFFA